MGAPFNIYIARRTFAGHGGISARDIKIERSCHSRECENPVITNIRRSGQIHNVDAPCSNYSINWILAVAGMT
jgi:hypothetical protein